MRITSFSIFNQLTRSLQENLRKLGVYSDRLSSGKSINKPSDDVSGMVSSMDYKISINEIEQYKKNIDDADSFLGMTDTIMGSVYNQLDRARELAVRAANDSLEPEDRVSISKEIENLRDEVMRLSQTKLRDRYIFSGYKTDTVPFDGTFTYQGNSSEIEVFIDRDSTMAINVSGDEAFSYGGETFMETLDDLYNALNDIDPDAARAGAQTAIDKIEDAITQIANVRATVGAKMSRLENLQSSLDDRSLTFNTLLSNTQDADLADTVTQISKIQGALESLRASGSKVISQSLLDFLG
ncbi:MAG: flagellar hook-associated protein FlgL [Nitrospirae bacterium]|nr:flagellar hook-associated protein FlgL [Nitrospirota bacterium]